MKFVVSNVYSRYGGVYASRLMMGSAVVILSCLVDAGHSLVVA
jgi:hypothetical protein